MKSTIIFICINLFWGLTSFCQNPSSQVIAASGDEFKSSDISLSWTIGETITETINNNTITLTQGFHQSKIIITSIDQLSESKFALSAYPNPTSGVVYLKIETENVKNLQYQLIDSKGTLLTRKEISSNTAEIDFHNFSNGIYLLEVFENQTILKSFKILKQ